MTVVMLAPQLAAAAGTGGWMSDNELQATFDGRAVDGHYEDGDRFEETYMTGGRVSYRDSNRSSGGRWSIQSGTFCTIYDDDPAGGCYRVRRDGENCFEFYFVARTEAQASGDPRTPHWTARAWYKDKPSTCVDGQNV
jgi:hypothetical protein